MSILLNPYISFKDNAREAMTFYQSVLGGKLSMYTFKDFGQSTGPENENLIMHSSLETDSKLVFMAADTAPGQEPASGVQVQMCLNGDNADTLRAYYNGLSQGGQILMKLEKSAWGSVYGMFVDKFGIIWQVDIATAE